MTCPGATDGADLPKCESVKKPTASPNAGGGAESAHAQRQGRAPARRPPPSGAQSRSYVQGSHPSLPLALCGSGTTMNSVGPSRACPRTSATQGMLRPDSLGVLLHPGEGRRSRTVHVVYGVCGRPLPLARSPSAPVARCASMTCWFGRGDQRSMPSQDTTAGKRPPVATQPGAVAVFALPRSVAVFRRSFASACSAPEVLKGVRHTESRLSVPPPANTRTLGCGPTRRNQVARSSCTWTS